MDALKLSPAVPTGGQTPHAAMKRRSPHSADCLSRLVEKIESDPNGTRTRVTAVKGRCPRPLDDGASGKIFKEPKNQKIKEPLATHLFTIDLLRSSIPQFVPAV